MPNTGGDFLGAVPKACFQNQNPCVALGGKVEIPLSEAEKMANLNRVIEAGGAGSGHLNDARAAQQAVSPDDNAISLK
jgi:hypothetical protein